MTFGTAVPSQEQQVHYLSTLQFEEPWLDRLRALSPRLVVTQLRAETAEDIPPEIWRRTTVLHTSSVLPLPQQAPELRWVQLDTSGVDHLVGHPLWASGVPFTTIGGVSPVSMAEYVICTVLGFAHRMPAVLAVASSRQWPDRDTHWRRFKPATVAGATMAVIGFGRIGREIGRLATAHGLRVVGVNSTGRPPIPREDQYQGHAAVRRELDSAVEVFATEALHDVLRQADYVVLVVPLTVSTRNLMSADAFGVIKPGAVVINVARGGIVDEDALAAALRSGRVAGAAMDVFADEPLPADSPWWSEPNVLVTPHIAGLAGDYDVHVETLVRENLGRLLDGLPLLNQVDPQRGY